MFPKRPQREEGDGDSGDQNKRRQSRRSMLKGGAWKFPKLQEMVLALEPTFRTIVREEIAQALDRFPRLGIARSSSSSGVTSSCSRTLQLRFCSKLPNSLFTNQEIMSNDKNPIKLSLWDSISKEIVTSGPFSSSKVHLFPLSGDFPDDWESWSEKDFERHIVKRREGRTDLLAGELTVSLQNGVGQIGQVRFTDNSSWVRSGKFRLGAEVFLNTGERSIREAVSNRFKIKDQRGQAYEKHHPPALDDEVWRLEKISKGGKYHDRLTNNGVSSVRDFLRWFEINPSWLRNVLDKISDKAWEAIVGHAITCCLDDKRYMYRSPIGVELFFNSILKVVEVRLGGQIYPSVDALDEHQKAIVEDVKRQAYSYMTNSNMTNLREVRDLPILDDFTISNLVAFPNGDIHAEHGQLGMHMNNHQPAISFSAIEYKLDSVNGCFEMGESSGVQGFSPTSRNSFQINAYSPGASYENTCTLGGISLGTTLPAQDLPANNHFQGEPSAWQEYGPFPDPNHQKLI